MIEIKEDFRIPGTKIILEAGDRLEIILEATKLPNDVKVIISAYHKNLIQRAFPDKAKDILPKTFIDVIPSTPDPFIMIVTPLNNTLSLVSEYAGRGLFWNNIVKNYKKGSTESMDVVLKLNNVNKYSNSIGVDLESLKSQIKI